MMRKSTRSDTTPMDVWIRRVSTMVMAVALVAMATACNRATSPTMVASVAVTGTAPVLGATSQFRAVATMSDGSTQDVTTLATWLSSDGSTVTVSSAGVVTAVAAGVATVQATYLTVTGSDQITLAP